MSHIRRGALVSLCAVALILAASTTAVASSSIKSVIRAQDSALNPTGKLRSTLKHPVLTKRAAPEEIRLVQSEVDKLDHAQSVVARASVSGAKQRQGRGFWVAGVGLVAKGYETVIKGFKAVERGDQTTARASFKAGSRTLNHGFGLIVKADRDLGLPILS